MDQSETAGRAVIDRTPSREPARLIEIDGTLPYGRRLCRPMPVVIEWDDREILVSEPNFQMHAGGATVDEAIAAFRRIISGYVDVLEGEESQLGEGAAAQLAYLRSFIVPA
ncbi:MAG TPA: hypothetical protein VNL35_04185 [Chloroflexota bacterium]|nr:hypothetical protein [Chloroflexota bacterium]